MVDPIYHSLRYEEYPLLVGEGAISLSVVGFTRVAGPLTGCVKASPHYRRLRRMDFTVVEAGYSVLYIVVGKPLFSPIHNTAFTPVITATLVALTTYVSKTMTGKHIVHRGSG